MQKIKIYIAPNKDIKLYIITPNIASTIIAHIIINAKNFFILSISFYHTNYFVHKNFIN